MNRGVRGKESKGNQEREWKGGKISCAQASSVQGVNKEMTRRKDTASVEERSQDGHRHPSRGKDGKNEVWVFPDPISRTLNTACHEGLRLVEAACTWPQGEKECSRSKRDLGSDWLLFHFTLIGTRKICGLKLRKGKHIKTQIRGLPPPPPQWFSGWESTFKCRGCGFNPWSGN